MNIDFPFHFNSRGQTATSSRDDHIRDMIELLLFTDPGERVNRPEFGSGLRQLIFAPNSPELATALKQSMQGALQLWLGDIIDLEELEVTSEDSQVRILVSYRVRDEQISSPPLELIKKV